MFLLSSLVRACRYTNNDRVRTKLPIQKDLLIEILKFMDDYYFGLFRVCELTLTASAHSVRVGDVHIANNKKKILFILRTSKTQTRGSKPQMINISTKGDGTEVLRNSSLKQKTAGRFCPYKLLGEFIALGPKYLNCHEQFFILRDYSPVTALHMRSTLHPMLKLMQFEHNLYNCYSFRIGRSCDLMKYGL